MILFNIFLSRGIHEVTTWVRFENEVLRSSSSWENNQKRGVGNRGNGSRGRSGYRGSRYRVPARGSVKITRKAGRSQSQEDASESAREVGFEYDSCGNCGQGGHWAKE